MDTRTSLRSTVYWRSDLKRTVHGVHPPLARTTAQPRGRNHPLAARSIGGAPAQVRISFSVSASSDAAERVNGSPGNNAAALAHAPVAAATFASAASSAAAMTPCASCAPRL